MLFTVSALAVIVLFFLGGTLSGGATKTAGDFTLGGRRSSSASVVGILLGALVGGASTVGTVQMAYQYGFSAWWFTLGGGLGCLVLGLWFASPLRNTELTTIPQFLRLRYGGPTAATAMIASILGTFISVVAQFLSGIALLQNAFPLSPGCATLATAFLVMSFIFAGGLRSFGALGKAKILFLYLILGICAGAAWLNGATPGALWSALPFHPFFNLFGRGFSKDLGAATSLLVGVLSTQIYIQSIFAASDAATARRGALLSALIMPPLGIFGVWVGLHMRTAGITLPPAQALSHFIRITFSPLVAGILWSGILITVIGCAAGLALGIATNLVQDVLLPLAGKRLSPRSVLQANRWAVFLVVLAAAGFGLLGKDSLILVWSYLSMGLRGAGTFLPLVFAVLFPERIPARIAFASSVGGIATTLLWPLAGLGGEPLFAGLAVAGACLLPALFLRSRGAAPRDS
jgi:SSS family solute:Na+ symporter